MNGMKCSHEREYAKAEGEDSDVDSSEEKSDHLSYSYSCVKSFRKNQHIIGDLAALSKQQEFQGTTHQPALYSLSGERNRPVCQPFYYTAVSERSDCSGEEQQHEQHSADKDNHITSSASLHQLPAVKDMFVQWLKHQYKQVNSYIKKEIFMPKFRKRNQKMKMEMTLNGVDEETKQRLIGYINKFNLGFEEHCNLCTGNETVFEIDVTSILDDPPRLQEFLNYLKSIDSEKSKVPITKVAPDLKGYVDVEYSPGRNNIRKKDQKKKNHGYQTKSSKKSAALGKNTYQTYSSSATSSESECSSVGRRKLNTLKQDKINQTYKEGGTVIPTKCEYSERKRGTNHQIWKTEVSNKIVLPECEEDKSEEVIKGKTEVPNKIFLFECEENKSEEVEVPNKIVLPEFKEDKSEEVIKGKTEVPNTIVLAECEENKSEELVKGKKRVRKISTVSRKKDMPMPNMFDKSQANFEQNNEISSQRNVQYNVFNVQTNIASKKTSQFQPEVKRELSCKCLMHHNREDFYRYKNQCLFGKGDEINNSFIKYVDKQKIKPDLSHFQGKQQNYFTNDVDEDENFDNNVALSKRYLHYNSKENISENLGILKPKEGSNDHKEVSVPQNERIDAHKETYCLNLCSDNDIVKGNVIATNACFKSLSYCIESFQNTRHVQSVRETEQEKNKYSHSSKEKNILNTCVLQAPFETTGMHYSTRTEDQAKITQKQLTNGGDYDYYVNVNVPDSNLKTLSNKCYFKKAMYNTNLITTDQREPQVCICNDNHFLDRGDIVQQGNAIRKNCESNKQQIFPKSLCITSKENEPKVCICNDNHSIDIGDIGVSHKLNNTMRNICVSNKHKIASNSLIITNKDKEQKVCICNDNHSINRDVKDTDKLHNSISNTSMPNKHEIFTDLLRDLPISCDDHISQKVENSKCCIFGCECGKNMKRKSKIKTIVFKIGSSNKELKISSVPSLIKRKSKLQSLKPKEVCCDKISSVFKVNESLQNEYCPHKASNNEMASKNVCLTSVSDTSLSEKSDTNSSTWVNCEDHNNIIDSLNSGSKGTTLTPNSLNLESSPLLENSLRILVSELKSQRMEIDFMKTLLGNKILSKNQ